MRPQTRARIPLRSGLDRVEFRTTFDQGATAKSDSLTTWTGAKKGVLLLAFCLSDGCDLVRVIARGGHGFCRSKNAFRPGKISAGRAPFW
jgi:hypothetical protein